MAAGAHARGVKVAEKSVSLWSFMLRIHTIIATSIHSGERVVMLGPKRRGFYNLSRAGSRSQNFGVDLDALRCRVVG